ncbi:hypothetical protein [Massilia sp. LjRoot122]|uniref:hypothetical protein n=1 Tax=Massilia sp. LjRoot122 TaxID=3342257 RepID=UPI003ECCB14C
MTILKHAAGACILVLAAAGADSLLSAPAPNQSNPAVQAAGGHPPTVDMRQFQRVFN